MFLSGSTSSTSVMSLVWVQTGGRLMLAALFLGLMCQFDQRSEYLEELGEPQEEAAFP